MGIFNNVVEDLEKMYICVHEVACVRMRLYLNKVSFFQADEQVGL